MINCLKGNQALLLELKAVMEHIIVQQAAAAKPIDFKRIYSEFSKHVDIDVETAAAIYEDSKGAVASQLGEGIEGSFSSSEELDALVKGDAAAFLNELAANKVGPHKPGAPKKISVGDIGRIVARSLINLIDNRLFQNEKNEPTRQALIQKLYNYSKSKLGDVKGKRKIDVLAEALAKDYDSNQQVGSEELFEQIKKEIDEIAKSIPDKATRNIFLNEFAKLQEASFNLGISKTGWRGVINDILKNSEFGKETNRKDKDGNLIKIVDWNKISKAGDMAATLKKLLDAKLKAIGYKGDPTKIYNALINQYNQLLTTAALTRVFQGTNQTLGKLADEVAISHGFYTMQGARKVVNYNADTEEGRKSIQEALDEAQVKITITPTNAKFAITSLVEAYSKVRNHPALREAMRRLMAINNRPYLDKAGKIDRLVSLLQKNIGVDTTTNAISAKILGVAVKGEYIKEYRALIDAYKQMLEQPDDSVFANAGITDAQAQAMGLPADFKFARTSVIAKENIYRQMSQLLSKIIRGNDFTSLPGFFELIDKLQRMQLSAKLTNPRNVFQNLVTAVFSVSQSKTKFSTIKDMSQAFGLVFNSIITGGPIGTGLDEIYKTEDTTTISQAKGQIQKVLYGVKWYAEALLTSIDAAAQVATERNLLNQFVIDTLRAQKQTDSQIDKIMKTYTSGAHYVLAKEIASRNLIISGMVKGSAAYRKALERETMNIQSAYFLGGPLKAFMSPEQVQGYMETAHHLAQARIGKTDFTVKKVDSEGKVEERSRAIWNPFSRIQKEATRLRNQAFDNVIANPTKINKAKFVAASAFKMIMSVGPLSYAGGAFRFGEFALNASGLGLAYGLNISDKKQNMTELMSASSDVNINELQGAIEDYQINKFKLAQAVSGLLLAAAFITPFMIRAFGDDDEKDVWGELIDAIDKMSNASNHVVYKDFVRYLAPPLIRGMYNARAFQLKAAKKHENEGLAFVKGFINAFYSSRTPLSPSELVDSFKDPRTGEIKKEDIIRQLANTYKGWVLEPLTGGMITNFALYAKEAWKGVRAARDYNDSPLVPASAPAFMNPIVWGVTGDNFNLLFQDHVAATGSLMLFDKSDKSYGEIEKEAKGSKFSEIKWSEHGYPEWDTKAKKDAVNDAYNHLDRIKDAIKDAATFVDVSLKDQTMLDFVWDLPSESPFSVVPKVTDKDIARYTHGDDVKIGKNGTVNILSIVKARLENENYTTENILIARKYEIAQEQLLGKRR